MSAIFILLGASLSIAVGFLIAFIWSVKNGQYDDEYTPSVRMLFDETSSPKVNVKPELNTVINPNNHPSS
ncbi:MAG: cbb3-type cytochrome oxidase assembly protein CcoS [Bacteroidia bacterium]